MDLGRCEGSIYQIEGATNGTKIGMGKHREKSI
jgi:hypothetical protein